MEKNAIEDDEIVSIRQRKEAREAFEVASWKRLRQYLWEGRLTAYYFYTNGQLLKLEATGWGGTWADGMHELVASGATETGTLIINEFELEAVLSGNQPEASVRTPQSSETVERDPERGVNRTEKRDGPPAKSAPVRNVTKGEIEAVYRNWIAQHKGRTPPSRKDDWRYMQGRFPQLRRARMRKLRNELAPSEWSRPGRRKETSGRKLAKKS
jgi:hypothetical protein